uniref:Uncharacterized protein n=1 Tax=Anguilla anguilla TaxID=7936 RepID=A0A0E9VQY5_ANGAN
MGFWNVYFRHKHYGKRLHFPVTPVTEFMFKNQVKN